jgi:hypothetical protein
MKDGFVRKDIQIDAKIINSPMELFIWIFRDRTDPNLIISLPKRLGL